MTHSEPRLAAYAAVIVQVGLNLQPGQRLLIAEPYELQGVSRSAEKLVAAVTNAALASGCPSPAAIEIIWGDPTRLREFAANKNWRGLTRLVADNATKMNDCVQRGDAILFLLGSQSGLMEGIPPQQVAEARAICSSYFGGIARQLMQGATNWTATPSPSPEWADLVYADLPPEQRMPALWAAVFDAIRMPPCDANSTAAVATLPPTGILTAWATHLRTLQKHRDDLNTQRFKSLHYQGEGTDLTVTLPAEHLWCTAHLRSKAGFSFVANLPTEEAFTLPHRDSAQGTVRVARPITFGGSVIDGIELEFARGCVVKATAKTGETLLHRLLETDAGACRLGEVALVGENLSRSEIPNEILPPAWAKQRLFHHALLDENACSHIALGDSYGFCLSSPNPSALNHSLIHIDLPIAAKANLRT